MFCPHLSLIPKAQPADGRAVRALTFTRARGQPSSWQPRHWATRSPCSFLPLEPVARPTCAARTTQEPSHPVIGWAPGQGWSFLQLLRYRVFQLLGARFEVLSLPLVGIERTPGKLMAAFALKQLCSPAANGRLVEQPALLRE
jgi:hypothetical protein